MGKHSGAPAATPRPPSQRKRMLLLAAGLTLALVAWGYLVSQAIAFGTDARDGSSGAWVFLVFAIIGGTACLFVVLVLAGKLLAVLRGDAPPPPRPPSSTGGRRAAR